jgi:RNA polymerase sigma factor (TIGR02999 family)
MPGEDEISALLYRAREGDDAAAARAFELLYHEMRRIARTHLNRERTNHTLQPTALVNEVFVRVFGNGPPAFQGRAHFLAVASRAMRCLLVDHARAKRTGKRGRDFQVIALDNSVLIGDQDWPKLLILNEALDRLAGWDARQCQVVEMRFFGGLTEDEIAAILNVSVRTVKRDWEHARAWLRAELADPTSEHWL